MNAPSSSTDPSHPSEAASARQDADDQVRKLTAEMGREWAAGRRLAAEDVLASHPELRDDPDVVLELVYEEICLRRRYGESSSTTEIINRFPRWRDQLEVLLSCDRLLNPEGQVSARSGRVAGPPRFPSVGEKLADFHLLAELGSGSVGRVFLATQPALAHRPVVLKMTPLATSEYLSLARLQHTNIVPLYSVQDDPGRNLRILCMPWFGGATLARILALLGPIPLRERTGRSLVAALDKDFGFSILDFGLNRKSKIENPKSSQSSIRQFLARSSYVGAICWIGAWLADALQYVHERGAIHLDIKPSNVLLADDGQPMLLDFHLARGPLAAGEPAPDWLGGTPAYMSPEQQAALAAVRLGRPLTQGVDGRSDVYSLGLLLLEALGGAAVPTHPSGPVEIPKALPGVSVGLRDILARCLRPDLEKRYPDAASLAADLRCHLNNLPLRGVANRSWLERLRKWRRRQPHRSALLAMAGIVLLAMAGVALISMAHLNRHVSEARTALADGVKDLERGHYNEAREHFRHGRALLDCLPGYGELKQDFIDQEQRADRFGAGEELHQVVERLRFLYGQNNLPATRSGPLAKRCRALWEARASLLEAPASDPGEERQQRIRLDLLDLAVLWSDLLVRSTPEADRSGARHSALAVLKEAESLLGPHPILYAERQELAVQLGLADEAAEAGRRLAGGRAGRSAWEHYALGRFRLRQGRWQEAAGLFDQAVALQPDSFWAHFYRGQCAYRQGQPVESIASFTACLALTPERAVCYYNRALAYAAAGRDELALLDYDKSLLHDSKLGPAWLNRGVLHYRAGRYGKARADLEEALRHQVSPAAVHYNLALVSQAEGNRAAARASAREALKHDPGRREARSLLRRLEQDR